MSLFFTFSRLPGEGWAASSFRGSLQGPGLDVSRGPGGHRLSGSAVLSMEDGMMPTFYSNTENTRYTTLMYLCENVQFKCQSHALGIGYV